ncbi:MAG: hypothetical protein JEZ06_22360 [Anaerolineaceae bacterium]|nr:hypothetical protein [Anaerolineaceae bacterium]
MRTLDCSSKHLGRKASLTDDPNQEQGWDESHHVIQGVRGQRGDHIQRFEGDSIDGINTYRPMTLATIPAFRKMLDVMEAFVRNAQAERMEEEQAGDLSHCPRVTTHAPGSHAQPPHKPGLEFRLI